MEIAIGENAAGQYTLRQSDSTATTKADGSELMAIAADIADRFGDATLSGQIEALGPALPTITTTLMSSSIKPCKSGVPPTALSFFVEVVRKPASGSAETKRFTAVSVTAGTTVQKEREVLRDAIAAWLYLVGHQAGATAVYGLSL